jgi:hypothetical protein
MDVMDWMDTKPRSAAVCGGALAWTPRAHSALTARQPFKRRRA